MYRISRRPSTTMYDRCAAVGTPISTEPDGREHGMMPPRKKV